MKPTLTLDLGTTNFKACVFDQRGRLCVSTSVPTPTEHPHPGWVQIEPGVFRSTIERLITDLRQADAQGLRSVEQVSFATQTNSFILLDKHAQPTTPIILWNDRRAWDLGPEVQRLVDSPTFSRETGMPGTSPQSMVTKLLWLRQNQPRALDHAHRLCLISDYLTWWLTGQHVSEAGAAGLTAMIDIHRLTWRDREIGKFTRDQLQLPEIKRPGTDVGPIQSDVARTLGLPDHARFVLGCLDQYAGAIGVGNVVPGMVSETTGTVLATVALAEQFEPTLADQGVVQGPAFQPGWYFRMAFSSVSANLLEAYRQAHLPDWSDQQLSDAAESVSDDAALPVLDRSASRDAGAAVFQHRTAEHGPAHDIRAIMTGVADALADQLALIVPHGRISEIHCAGGAARSRVWLRIKAKRLGIAMVALDCPEPTSYGAALVSNLHNQQLPPDRTPLPVAYRAE